MREHYDLEGGRPNPYVGRLGVKGRAELVRWWADVTAGVRVLPEDVAREFPDTETTVEALRLVMKLRDVKPRRARPPVGKQSVSKRKSGAGR